MDLALIDPSKSAKSSNPFLLGNYELTLNQSIQNLLRERHNDSFESSSASTFYELMQARADPPLEATWVYSLLSFHSSKFSNNDPLNRVAVAKCLFQLVSACSSLGSSSKNIALLAPVVFEVYNLVVELLEEDSSLNKEKKAVREVVSLVEVIIGYISVCCAKDLGEENDDSIYLITSLGDLIRLWIGQDEQGRDDFGYFFPLVGEEVRRGLRGEGCEVSYLAGVVMAEAFLLRLCLNIRFGLQRAELDKELSHWAVSAITGIRNFYFFETLVRMLLEPKLPVTSLLKSDHIDLLRKVLYDAVILVEYSFLNPEKVIRLPAERVTGLVVTRSIVTHEAVEFFRENGDSSRAISYIKSFKSSRLVSQLIKWVTIVEGRKSKPNEFSPKALIKWLLNVEVQGLKIFDDSTKCRAKLVLNDDEQPSGKLEDEKLDASLGFYIDNRGGEEMNESMNAAFVAAAHEIKSADENKGKKRKGKSSEKKRIKFVKYDVSDNINSGREKASLDKDETSSSGSEGEDN